MKESVFLFFFLRTPRKVMAHAFCASTVFYLKGFMCSKDFTYDVSERSDLHRELLYNVYFKQKLKKALKSKFS